MECVTTTLLPFLAKTHINLGQALQVHSPSSIYSSCLLYSIVSHYIKRLVSLYSQSVDRTIHQFAYGLYIVLKFDLIQISFSVNMYLGDYLCWNNHQCILHLPRNVWHGRICFMC